MKAANSTSGIWIGRILKGLLCLFILFDGVIKIVKHPKAVEGTLAMGLPETSVQFLGVFLLTAMVLYLIPRLSNLGMLFMIAYLGGAAAVTYLNTPATFGFLFPVVFAVLIVLAQYLLNESLRNALLPRQKAA